MGTVSRNGCAGHSSVRPVPASSLKCQIPLRSITSREVVMRGYNIVFPSSSKYVHRSRYRNRHGSARRLTIPFMFSCDRESIVFSGRKILYIVAYYWKMLLFWRTPMPSDVEQYRFACRMISAFTNLEVQLFNAEKELQIHVARYDLPVALEQ